MKPEPQKRPFDTPGRGRLPHDSLSFHRPKVKPENVQKSLKYKGKQLSLFMFLSFTPTHPRDARARVCARGGGERVKPEWFLPGHFRQVIPAGTVAIPTSVCFDSPSPNGEPAHVHAV